MQNLLLRVFFIQDVNLETLVSGFAMAKKIFTLQRDGTRSMYA